MPELESNKVVIRPMTLDQLLISLDRLTRFKYLWAKKDRVFKEIIVKHAIFPKITTRNLHNYPKGVIEQLVQLIWNTSVDLVCQNNKKNINLDLNLYMAYEDTKTFSSKNLLKDLIFSEGIIKSKKSAIISNSELPKIIDKNGEQEIIEILNENGYDISLSPLNETSLSPASKLYLSYALNKPLNISSFLIYLEKDKSKELPDNIKYLIEINNLIMKYNNNIIDDCDLEKNYQEALKINRNKAFGFPPKLLVLVEGATEEILLPVFADNNSVNFKKHGIQILGAGGKNQVAKLYYELKDKINIPVFIILDADAKEIADKINSVLLPKDCLYLISQGEFEDILPIKLICNSINKFYTVTGKVSISEINQKESMATILHEIWKEKGFGDFKKAEFAQIVAGNIKSNNNLSTSLKEIIQIIKDYTYNNSTI